MYNDMTAKDFLRMLGANEKILDNPSLDIFLSDVGISAWTEFRKKRSTDVISDNNEKVVTFYHDASGVENYETKVRVSTTGDVTVSQSFDRKLSDFEHTKTVTVGKIITDEKGITTREFTAIGKQDERTEGRIYTGQTEKNYDSNGVEMVRSYAEGPFVDSNHSNFVFDKAYMNEWTVVRREPIGYVALVHSEGKDKAEINGYVELDTRYASSLVGKGGLSIDNKSLTTNIDAYTPNILPDTLKQEVLNNMDGSTREYFEEAFKKSFKPEYLNGVQINTLSNEASKTM